MKKLYSVISVVIALALVSLGAVCLMMRLETMPELREDAVMTAVALALPDGNYRAETLQVTASPVTEEDKPQATPILSSKKIFSEDPSIYSSENQYPIIERQYSQGDTKFDNFYLKNSTGLDLNVEKYLNNNLGFKTENDKEVVEVLIVHTHTSESYMTYDTGYYHESFYSRSTDNEKNMVRVGEEIARALRQNGIGVVHAADMHDNPRYDGAYYRSYDTILKYMEKYPDIKVVLDIHRDSISTGEDRGKVKPTFVAGGKKAAQIMIMAGYDPDGSLDFPLWEENLTFALKLQQKAEEMYPGMTRPLYFGNFVYNMNVNNGSLLIEVGTEANTLEEAVYTGGLLGNVLSEVLQRG